MKRKLHWLSRSCRGRADGRLDESSQKVVGDLVGHKVQQRRNQNDSVKMYVCRLFADN